MSEPFIGEIKMFAGNFAPAGWLTCEGQSLAISEYDTLFNLIGTTYGGDGQETFNVPNLASRVPIHMGTGPGLQTYQLGELAGVESVTLNSNTTPIHTHPLLATATGQTNSPLNAYFASVTSSQSGASAYDNADASDTILAPTSVLPQGGSQPHNNIQPSLAINYIISLFGIYPSQN